MKKIVVNTENVLSALFILGYDRIDPFMYTAVMGSIAINRNNEKYEIEFVNDSPLSKPFLACVDMDVLISLKENCNMDTNVASAMRLSNVNYSFGSYIRSSNNLLLVDYINEYIDLKKICIEKINKYGVNYIKDYPHLFCDKEKNIILEVFGINDMFRSMSNNSSKYHQMLYEQEEKDIDNAIQTLE